MGQVFRLGDQHQIAGRDGPQIDRIAHLVGRIAARLDAADIAAELLAIVLHHLDRVARYTENQGNQQGKSANQLGLDR
ncbi:hypothetical protein D3C78_1486960 [compost metagenome]